MSDYTYQRIEGTGIFGDGAFILRSDSACIPFDENNSDYQKYLLWVASNGSGSPDSSGQTTA